MDKGKFIKTRNAKMVSMVFAFVIFLFFTGHRVSASSKLGTWQKSSDGRWWFKYYDGSYAKNIWEYINGKWYRFDSQGWMQTGWKYVDGYWYFMQYDSGAMQTGWIYDSADRKWYYSNEKGEMQTGWIPLEYGDYNNGKPYWNFFAYSTGEFLTDSDVQGDVYGKNTFGNFKFINAPKLKYYIDYTAASKAGLINSATDSWSSGTSISFMLNPSTFDVFFYREKFSSNYTWGQTFFQQTNFSDEIDPWNQNWGYVRIKLSDYNDVRIGTISHEIGHALGLSHRITNYYSIMKQGSLRQVNFPQQIDFDVVNHLYGY